MYLYLISHTTFSGNHKAKEIEGEELWTEKNYTERHGGSRRRWQKMEDLCVSWLMTDDPLGIKGGR